MLDLSMCEVKLRHRDYGIATWLWFCPHQDPGEPMEPADPEPIIAAAGSGTARWSGLSPLPLISRANSHALLKSGAEAYDDRRLFRVFH
jgi:hypothetical protein